MKKLDFIIFGFQKSGTTTLFRLLKEHPNICFYEGRKDPQFFNRHENWKELVPEYHTHFRDKNKLWGEASDQYTIFPEYVDTHHRIYEYNPNIKLIGIIRDPVERTLSHYDFNKVRGGAKGASPEDVILTYSKYITRSSYWLQIKLYLNAGINKENILLIFFEDLMTDSVVELNKITNFLKINPFKDDTELVHRKSTTNEAHLKFKYRKLFKNKIATHLRTRLPKQFRMLIKPLFYGIIKEKTLFKSEFKKTLWHLLEEDVNNLENEFQLDCNNWRNKYKIDKPDLIKT